MYRIYINQTALILADSSNFHFGNNQPIDPEGFEFPEFYSRLKKEKIAGEYVLLSNDPKKLFKQLKSSLKFIKAAGGIVSNEENNYLFIFRNGKWDLPKGKIEKDEKTRIAAVREVEEECGIIITSNGDKLCKTYHVYEMNGQIVLKKTSWYRMRADNQRRLKPQLEEGITDARWLAPGDFHLVKQNTYPLIRDVLSMIES